MYCDRREFLIASVSDTRNRYHAVLGDDGSSWYGFAATEHQFRKALCELVFPTVKRVTRNEMQALMADELKELAAMGEA